MSGFPLNGVDRHVGMFFRERSEIRWVARQDPTSIRQYRSSNDECINGGV
jgi:hypothetical protein